MDWGRKVREYREKMLLTQKELAVILGVGTASIARWENGYYEPTIRIKRKIKFLLQDSGISLED